MLTILGGLSFEIVVPSAASNYTCCVFIETTPPSGGSPPHKHRREAEIFTVLEGDCEFLQPAGIGRPMTLGRPIMSQRGTYQAFRNTRKARGRMMLTTNAGCINDCFRVVAELKMFDHAERMNEISAHYGYIYKALIWR